MKYTCKNRDCKNFNEEKFFIKTTTTFIGDKLVTKESICSCCGEIMDETEGVKSISIESDSIYNYFCKNESCQEKKTIEIKKNKKDEDREEFCSCCGSKLERLGVKCEVFGRFESLPVAEKKKKLKKRSTDHFNKYIKPKAEYQQRVSVGLEN